ncbi:hypothetical protein DFH09DRAFT_1393289 [Mycena vulgaris]|nr:hypothetical protein DFH09DRAFT_1393289 [Mycena vulgaris]
MDPANLPAEPVDVNALLAANAELTAMLGNMQLGYQQQAEQFSASLHDDFTTMQAERDTARQESQRLAAQVADTLSRLERMEKATTTHPDIDMGEAAHTGNPAVKRHEPTRDPRSRHTTTRDPRPRPQAAPSIPNSRTSSNSIEQSPTPERVSNPPPATSHYRSSGTNNSIPSPRTKPSPRSGPQTPRSSAPSTSSSPHKAKIVKPSPRKPAEHQMLRGDVEKAAETFKALILPSNFTYASSGAAWTPPALQNFELRFKGLTVLELKRTGQIGQNIIDPADVEIGLNVQQAIRSKNKIIAAFFKLEESALLHVRAYLAKLGIYTWAPDYSQTPYSMYNMAMRMCAIDTFRFLVTGTYYDFLRPNTSFIEDSALLARFYDHFIHHYMFDKWKVEIRTPGGMKRLLRCNNAYQSRIRLHKTRSSYLNGAAAPAGVKLMFLHARRGLTMLIVLIRAVDTLIVEDLLEEGKKRAAALCQRRAVPHYGQRNPSRFLEVPKEMPIQYYAARKKLNAQLIVAFVPGSSDFFSRRSDNVLSVGALTEKYGEQVFAAYDLDYGNPEPAAEASGVNAGSAASSDDEGESVGSSNSEAEQSAIESDNGSIASFISDDEGGEVEGIAGSGSEDDDAVGGDLGSDADEDRQAAFASAYDIQMDDLEHQIFGGASDDD